MKDWFEIWFDSPYYPLLYKHRDESEANGFIQAVANWVNLPKGSACLDIACGRGRHSVSLHQLGFDVLGIDLSVQSIEEAKKMEQDGLRFEVRDMRTPFPKPGFHLALNIFTSFGYFEHSSDHQAAMNAFASALLPGGILIMDYLSPKSVNVADNKVAAPVQEIVAEEVRFQIRKYIEGDYVRKDIEVRHDGKVHQFFEKVRLFEVEDLQELGRSCGLFPADVRGDYDLSPWSEGCERQIHKFIKQ
jgi:2-polyprenyl-3-methyl-5-hydroxy-6-metoxy-1,4-benzoquinol methylase